MLDSNKILKTFTGSAPIFPLPDFVMFPRTAYSFNIFEPRYKKLVSDILDGDNFFCSTLLAEKEENNSPPKFHSYGTLCYIIEHSKKDNGNYNIIASGLKKVSINEVESNHPYRIGELELIDDSKVIIEEQLKRKKLINKFISLITSNESEAIEIKSLDTSFISTEMLTNLACLVLPLDSKDKQKLLELNDVDLRLDVLCQFMDSELKVESDLLNFHQIIPTNIKWN
mgnify:CR=1 FL=1|tara:strand:- start:1087 stop:1767 length:681 start_codon:yes stop_codon:yes gene_type:complete